jgi:hypothetical protein
LAEIPLAPYLPTADPDIFESTPLAASGWYGDGQHGGVVSALMTRAIELVPVLTPMPLARVTVELFRVVPVALLRVSSEVIRQGKKIQVMKASLSAGGVELATATGLKLRRADLELPEESRAVADLPASPKKATLVPLDRWGVGDEGRILFHRHAIEVREVEGSYHQLGPAAVWFRLLTPLVAGEAISDFQRAVIVADFGNGISRQVHTRDWVFMNPDLTVNLHRHPGGQWLGLRARSWYDPSGRGVVGGELFDDAGPIGRSMQTVFLDRRVEF